MKTFTAALIGTVIVLAAGTASAQDAMKKDDAMAKGAMSDKAMTMQQCKDHMAMAKPDGMKKDDAMMKKDAQCAEMMKGDAAMKKSDPMMKKDDGMTKK